MELQDTRSIVTGAASGLGYLFAVELARAGGQVVAGDVNADGLRALEEAARGLPGRVTTRVVDIGQEHAVKAFVAEAESALAGINVLVNNAGVLLDGLLVKQEQEWVKRLPFAQWKKVLDVNLTGAFLMTREVAASLLERQASQGLIVNLSSLFRWGNAGQSAYAASKAGLDALTRTWALELGPYGIRVAGIAPGLVQTPILDNISEEARQSLLSSIPLRGFGAPLEIWKALRFILECDYFNGSILEVDGGASI